MSWKLIVPPVGLAISMEDAQLAARADVDADGESPLDADIVAAIRTYTAEAEGVTNRAIMQQTLRLTLDRFPPAIELCRPPLLQVDHVKWYDTDGVQKTLDPQDYEVDGESEPGCIVPAPGCAWPATQAKINAVEVQVRCGYGVDHTAVPDSIKGFIRARIAEQFKDGRHADNPNVTRLLWPEIVYS